MRLKNTTGVNVVLGKDISVLLCFQRLKSGRLVGNREQTGRFLLFGVAGGQPFLYVEGDLPP
jgi:hypothetical protein